MNVRAAIVVPNRIIIIATLVVFICFACFGQQTAPTASKEKDTPAANASTSPKGSFASDSRESAPLGSIAHQQQAQKSSDAAAKRHVFTNEDMPSHPAPPPEVKKNTSQSKDAKTPSGSDVVKPKDAGVELLNAIKEQKIKTVGLQVDLSGLQERVDSWRGDDCRKYYSEDGSSGDACQDVVRLVADRDRVKRDLEREQATLEEMQEKARKAGYTSKAYDPD